MAFFNLEDMDGSVEVVVFSDLFATCADLIESDDPLLVTAKLNRDENGFKLTGQEIISLRDAREKYTSALDIRVQSKNLHTESLHEFLKILTSYSGDCEARLIVDIPDVGETIFSLPRNMRVKPDDEFIRKVNSLFKSDAVQARFQ